MKKLIPVLVLGMVFLAAGASGQSGARSYLDLMVNMTRTNINYGAENRAFSDYKKSAKGIQAGLSLQAGVSSRFSVVSELYFLRKGGKLGPGSSLNAGESDIRLNTLEFPLLGRIHLGRFYFNAGPSVAYNMSGKQRVLGQTERISFGGTDNGFTRFDAGVQMGGGVEFPFRQKRIVLDIRYARGLTDISKANEMYTRALMVSVHFSKAWRHNLFDKKRVL